MTERGGTSQTSEYTPPSPEEIAKVRRLFARRGEVFIGNVVVDPYNPDNKNLELVTECYQAQYPDYDIRLEDKYIVWEGGMVFSAKNYARWVNVPDGKGLAVYLCPKGMIDRGWTIAESRDRLLEFINTGFRFPLITDETEWKAKIVDNARALFGESWRDEVLVSQT